MVIKTALMKSFCRSRARWGSLLQRRAQATTLVACWGLIASSARAKASEPIEQVHAEPQPTLVVLSVDGLMPKQVFGAEALGVHVPNLSRMVEEGAYATGVRGVVPSLTYPAHATLLTGVRPRVHGIEGNIVFDPTRTLAERWFWSSQAIKAPTLWQVAHTAHLLTANIAWPVTVEARIDYNIPQYWQGGMVSNEQIIASVSTPNLIEELKREVGPIPGAEDFGFPADEQRGKFARYLIEKKQPAFTTIYFGALDGIEHHTGPNSQYALGVLEGIDQSIGQLRNAIDRVTNGSGTFAVVSDHGFVAYHTEIEIGSLLRRHRFLDIQGETSVVSWRAAAWTAGGTAGIYLRNPHDEKTRESLANLMRSIKADPKYGIDRLIPQSEVRHLGGFRGAEWVLALKPGFKFGSKLFGPALVKKSGGTHGYLPDVEGMDAAFFIVGPTIPQGYNLGRIDMKDIAPVFASILSVDLPSAEGKNPLAPGYKNRLLARALR